MHREQTAKEFWQKVHLSDRMTDVLSLVGMTTDLAFAPEFDRALSLVIRDWQSSTVP